MEDCNTPTQCFLFIIRHKEFENLSKSGSSTEAGKIKAYVLLPTSVAESDPKLYQLLAKSDVEVLGCPQLPVLSAALQRDQVEVVELLFSKGGRSERLRVSVKKGNKALVKSILQHDFAVRKMKSSPSMIRSAVDKTNLEVVETLLAAKADVSCRNPRGGTLLHLAAVRNDQVLVKVLLKHGANVDLPRNDGATPLHLAVQKGSIEIVNLLLDKGATVNARRNDGLTSLQLAAAKKQEHIFEILLQSGATLPEETYKCLRLLQVVVQSNYDNIIAKIFSDGSSSIPEGVDENDVKSDLLLFAVKKQRLAVVKRLLEHGADVNAEDSDGRTVLELAVDTGSSEMVEVVLEHSPDLGETKIKNVLSVSVLRDDLSERVNLLVTAMRNGNGYDLDELFLDANRVRAKSESKLPILNRAAEIIKDLNTIDLLVKYGADINIRDKDNETPLTIAVKRNSLRLIKRLVKCGAHIDPKDEEPTPLEIALEWEYLSIVEYLIRNNAKIGIVCNHVCPLVYAGCCARAIDMLLNSGASYDGRNIDGFSPLHFAIENEQQHKLQIFLDHGFTNEKLLSKIEICNFLSNVIPVPVKDHIDSVKKDMMKSDNFKTCAMILARHMVKMEAAGLRYGEDNPMPEWYSKKISKEDFRKNCDAEIARMKAQKVDGTEVLFYSVLTGSLHRLTCYARNDNVVKMLTAKELIQSFPIYASIINCQLRKGLFQKDLLADGAKIFHFVFKKFPKLPDAIVQKILWYLHNQEIMVFITAVNPMAVLFT